MFSRTLFQGRLLQQKCLVHECTAGSWIAEHCKLAAYCFCFCLSLQGGMGAALLSQPDNVHKVSYTIP